ncbi:MULTISPECIES: DUF1120 domain-containing protein [Stenotrophomonas]|uniref:DUF1120 domain-containing protein n=1 Tax=Stenotrophomonas TaxID=40323 RepID=UPI000872D2B1|nr:MULTISPECIES: DUF1120 domain-containing protein [Stenotrophomonas]OEZ00660.1 hypothetical protein BIY45_10310 [Stenotrophomonas sp. BIIR7]
MKFATTLLSLAVVVAAPAAFAQSTDVSVTGIIHPGSCDIQLGGNGTIELGTLNTANLNTDVPTDLEPRTMTLAVACDSAMRFALEGIDNRQESSVYTQMYGLGMTPESERIGGAALSVEEPKADDAAAYGTQSVDSGTTWDASTATPLTPLIPDSLRGFTTEQGVTTGPAPISALTGNLVVGVRIQPTDVMRLTGEVDITGNITLNVIYL